MERIRLDVERCKGCGLCTFFCPQGVLTLADGINRHGYRYAKVSDATLCTSCSLCAIVCPDLAIEVFRFLNIASSEGGVADG